MAVNMRRLVKRGIKKAPDADPRAFCQAEARSKLPWPPIQCRCAGGLGSSSAPVVNLGRWSFPFYLIEGEGIDMRHESMVNLGKDEGTL